MALVVYPLKIYCQSLIFLESWTLTDWRKVDEPTDLAPQHTQWSLSSRRMRRSRTNRGSTAARRSSIRRCRWGSRDLQPSDPAPPLRQGCDLRLVTGRTPNSKACSPGHPDDAP